MPGGHLVLFPRQVGNGLLGRFGLRGDPDPSRAGQRDVRALRVEDLAAAPADKLVDVAGVVGKEHERLEMFDWRTGVVAQARQGEIDPSGIKVRQGRKFCRVINPVGRLIANLGKFRRREVAGQPRAHGAVKG